MACDVSPVAMFCIFVHLYFCIFGISFGIFVLFCCFAFLCFCCYCRAAFGSQLQTDALLKVALHQPLLFFPHSLFASLLSLPACTHTTMYTAHRYQYELNMNIYSKHAFLSSLCFCFFKVCQHFLFVCAIQLFPLLSPLLLAV